MFAFPNFNVPPPNFNETQNFPVDEDVDVKIDSFLKQHHLESNHYRKGPILRLSDVSSTMNNVTNLQGHLKHQFDALKMNASQLSEEEWGKKLIEIQEIQQKLDADTKFLAENSVRIQQLIKKRRNKRQNRNNRRKLLRHVLTDRQKKHQTIDDNLKKIKTQEEVDKKASLEKEETQLTLFSVNKRIRETKEKLELFDSLLKLRQIRQQQSQKFNDINENSFIEEISRMKELWTLALEEYQTEKAKLQEYLGKKFKPQQSIEQQWDQVLFGAPIPKKIDHPLLKADKNLASFLNIRQEWDSCIDVTGSKIPQFWVVPNHKNPEWQLYQENSN